MWWDMKCSLEWSLEHFTFYGKSVMRRWKRELLATVSVDERERETKEGRKNERKKEALIQNNQQLYLFRLCNWIYNCTWRFEIEDEQFSLVRTKKDKNKVKWNGCWAETEWCWWYLYIHMGDLYTNCFHVPNNLSSVFIVIFFFSIFFYSF